MRSQYQGEEHEDFAPFQPRVVERVPMCVSHFMGNWARRSGESSVHSAEQRHSLPPCHADQCDIWIEAIHIPSDYSIRASYCQVGSLQLRAAASRWRGSRREGNLREENSHPACTAGHVVALAKPSFPTHFLQSYWAPWASAQETPKQHSAEKWWLSRSTT